MDEIKITTSDPIEPAQPETIVEDQTPQTSEPKVDPVVDPVVEPVTETPQTVEQPVEPLSAKAVKIAKKERQVQEREKILIKAKEQVENKIASIRAFEDVKNNAKRNPIEYLKAAGLTFEEVAKFVLNDEKPTQETEIELANKRIETLEQRLEREAKEKEEFEIRRQETYINNAKTAYLNAVKDVISSNPDEFELLSANNADSVVLDVVLGWYNKHGEMMHPRDACKQVEAWYESQVAELKKLKKAQRLLGTEETKQQASEAAPKSPSVTLSNDVAPSSSKPLSIKMLPRDESVRRAAGLLRFN